MGGCAVSLQSDGHVGVGSDQALRVVVSECAAAEGLNVGEVDRVPYRCVGILDGRAGADNLDKAESGDEAWDVALAHVVLAAEVGHCAEEVVAMIEDDPKLRPRMSSWLRMIFR